MDQEKENKIRRTLGFIEKDRVIPDDPWFYSRLMARMEREIGETQRGMAASLVMRLKPVLVGIALLVAVSGGTWLGKVISSPGQQPEISLLSGLPETDATTILFQEVSGSFDEQILLMK